MVNTATWLLQEVNTIGMNAKGIPLREYPKNWRSCVVLKCCIDDYVFYWCQHSSNSTKTDKVEDRDHGHTENVFIVKWCKVKDMFYSMS